MNTMNTMNNIEHVDQDSVENVMAIVLSFMENAVNDAGVYVEHSGRRVISKKDIKMALQSETFSYMEREDMGGSLLYYKEAVHNDLEEAYNDDRDDNNDESETFLNSKIVSDSDMEEYSKSLCKCKVCTRLNAAVLSWPEWTPTTDIEHILKKVIDTKM